MKLSECALLADENIHAEVSAWLRSNGLDVVTTQDLALGGCSDSTVLEAPGPPGGTKG